MGTLASTYSYLILSLFLLIFAFLALALCPRSLRSAVLLSGLFSIPSVLASLDLVPAYWDPVRVAEFWIGPEDAIFSFSTGIIAFVVALWPIRKRIQVVFQTKPILIRLVLCYLCGFLLTKFFLRVFHIEPMQAALLTIIAIGFGLAILRKELIILSVYGVVSFTLFYTLYVKVGFLMFPEFINQWNLTVLSGISPLGIPLEEIAWAIAYGAVWPLMTGYILDLHIMKDYRQVIATCPCP